MCLGITHYCFLEKKHVNHVKGRQWIKRNGAITFVPPAFKTCCLGQGAGQLPGPVSLLPTRGDENRSMCVLQEKSHVVICVDWKTLPCHVKRERRCSYCVWVCVCFWVFDPFSVKLLVFIMASCCSSCSSSTTSQWVFPVIYLVLLCLLNGGGTTEAKCYSTIFGFGDSKTDTGQMQTAFPFQTAAEFWPYGRTFFGRPVNRYCDGRLVIDFMSEHWVPNAPIWVVLLVGYAPVSF